MDTRMSIVHCAPFCIIGLERTLKCDVRGEIWYQMNNAFYSDVWRTIKIRYNILITMIYRAKFAVVFKLLTYYVWIRKKNLFLCGNLRASTTIPNRRQLIKTKQKSFNNIFRF
jgi:hypothetical protein